MNEGKRIEKLAHAQVALKALVGATIELEDSIQRLSDGQSSSTTKAVQVPVPEPVESFGVFWSEIPARLHELQERIQKATAAMSDVIF